MKWIDAQEKLPSGPSKNYLIFDNEQGMTLALLCEDGSWIGKEGLTLNPTHWLESPTTKE